MIPPCSKNNFSRLALLSLLVAAAFFIVLSSQLIRSALAGRPSDELNLSAPEASTANRIANRYGDLPLRFETNEGQTDRQVKFLSRGPGYDLFLTPSQAVLTLRRPQTQRDKFQPVASADKPSSTAGKQLSVLYLKMIGANPKARVEGRDELPGKVNYLIGDDQDKWHTNIPTYLKVNYTNIYPGVDLVYYGNRTELEYDFEVAPGGNLQAIKFQLEGADRIKLAATGDLELTVGQREVKLRKPVIYQLTDEGDRREVEGSYLVKGKEVGFKVKSFDSRKPLIIDPVLSYSTLLGAGGNEYAYGIAVDPSGNAYITGVADSGGFPTTAGAFQTSSFGGAFVTKLDATGSNLIYSTYLSGSSGSGSTTGTAIAVDSSGNAYVTGYTTSPDFPTANALRGSYNFLKSADSGGTWIGKSINPPRDINSLVLDPQTPSTIYAGTTGGVGVYKSTDGGDNWVALNTGLSNAFVVALAIDPITPSTIYAATNIPTFGVLKSTNGGTSWVSLSGLSGTGGIYSLAIDPTSPSTLYLGSNGGLFKTTNGGNTWISASNGLNTAAFTIAIDPTAPSTIYVGGGAIFKSTNGGANWIASGAGLPSTTTHSIAIDPLNSATIYAGTGSGIFKSTNSGLNWTSANSGLANASIYSFAINPISSTIVYAGGAGGKIFKTLDGGNSWVSSYATIPSITVNSLVIDPSATSTVYSGNSAIGSTNDSEAFLSKLNATGSALIYSTFLGGSGGDSGYGVAVDSSGNAYVTGLTASTDFLTANPFQATLNGSTDAFVTKINSSGSALVYSTYLGGGASENGYGIAVDATGNAYVTGNTTSSNFPTANAFQSTFAGPSFGSDAFATKLNANGTLAYSTYLGGNDFDTGFAIAVDGSANAYITGITTSSNFPTANALQPNNGGFAGDAFVTKLNNLGSGLIYSTYLGGSNIDSGRGIAVDSAGNAYVTGYTNSVEFPLVAGALQTKSPFFKSRDGGSNWNNDNYGLKVSGLTCLTVDPVSPSTIYAGTSAGVYRSTDSGNNWTAVNNGLGNLRILEIVIDPITPANLYAASYDSSAFSSNGVYKSTNGGNSWTRMNNGMVNTSVQSLAIDPITPTTLYAGTYGGPIYKSTNGAGTWAPSGNPSIDFAFSLAVDPVTPSTVYAAEGFSNGGISKSVDGGATWQRVGFSQTGPYASFVAVSPLNHAKIYAVSNLGLFRSIDAGANWTLVGPYAFSKVVFDPVNSTTIYLVTTSQGILRSTDDGQSWKPINTGLRSAAAIALKINPANPSTFYAAIASSNDEDAFVSKINPSGTALIYSTYLGGSSADFAASNNNDEGFSIAVDSAGNAYVAGLSRSLDFPVTSNSYQPFNRGFSDSFVAKLTMSYLIGGQVVDGSNAPVSGAEVTLSDGTSLSSVLTESDGSYQFSHLREGVSFTVTATKPQFTMAPTSQTFSNLNNNQTANFIATATNAPFYTINGQITNSSIGLSGVTVTLSGSQLGIRTTDSNGNYSFTLAGGGDYTVTPAILGFTFTPPSQPFNNLSANQTANFAATRQNFVVTNTSDHGTGSLRQAILDANATAGTDTIVFNIPGTGAQTINLQIALPEITAPVVIDATTQPGFAGVPLIELNGALAGSNGSGFVISGGSSTIRGFVINRFSAGSGIALRTNGNNLIQGNYIGIDPTGTLRRANLYGISISNCSNNTIGGTTQAARNVVSANSFYGISLGADGNQIQGNFIGTNAAGTAALGNGLNGVDISGSPAFTNNVIGGTTAGTGNLISGNQTGIRIFVPGNSVQGNLIGTDVSGTNAVGNGIGISSSSANTVIGGTVTGARNIVSGNTGDGVSLGGTGSRLEGNFIGTDITGTLALGNGGSGVVAGNGALIGGTTPAARNVISGNGGFGNISLGSNSSGAQATVQGNYIGTDVTGNVALSNPQSGISISGSGNLIGGVVPGAQNVISGNRVGIQVGGSIAPGPTGNTIRGNLIGLNALGTSALPNLLAGIAVSDSSNNNIGDTISGAANRICFNGGPGVYVSSGTGNSIRGNSIFSNAGLGNDLTADGITGNDLGDTDTGANNLQNFPLLSLVSSNGGTTTIQGTLNSQPNTVFQIHFYSNSACDPSGNGEGAQFFDTTNVTTDANGNASINFTSSQVLAAGRVITATATDPGGNTSEFSSCDSNNATGNIQFKSASLNVLEDVVNATITVIRIGGSKGTLSVNYGSADGTATAGSDYSAVSGALVFGDGETSKTFTIPIVNDGISEPSETLLLALSGFADLEQMGNQTTATVTIQDDSTPLVLSLNSIDVIERNSGTTNAVVTASLSAATGRTVSADFSTVAATATSGVDFTPVSGNLNFAPGVIAQTITVPIIGDTLNENNETFQVVLSNPINATVGSSSLVRIINDDPLPSFSISDVNITEGNSGTVNAVFNLTLSTASGRALSVGYATANGTATAGSDYVATSGRVNFNAGETMKTITVQITGDALIEPDETFFVNLSSPSNATISDAQAVGTILNDDGAGVISFSQSNYSVAEDGGSAAITITRTGGSAGAATVQFSTSNGTATAGSDYTAVTNQTVTFNDGDTSKTVSVPITNDSLDENDETVNLTLSSPGGSGALGSPATAVLTINDDDPTPSLSINDVSLAEGNSGTTLFRFTVTLSSASGLPVTVNYATANGTADTSDYTAVPSTLLTFNAGDTIKTVDVLVNGDTLSEGNDTFFVNLSGATNATISDNQGLGTILNDDTPEFQFEQPSYTVSETGPSVSIVVKRTGDTSNAATVDYATNDFNYAAGDLLPAKCNTASGNASFKCDYVTTGGRLRFAATETSKTVVLPIIDDVFIEGDETLSMTLSNQSTGNLVSPSTTVITIQSNDTNQNATGADNPYLINAFFVRQQYLDFLLREPDTNGFNDWVGVLNNCQPNQGGLGSDPGCDRVHVTSGFFRSPEFGERGYWVYRFFSASLGRRPLYAEFMPEMRRLSGLKPQADLDKDEADFINEFMQRPEFTTIYNGIMDTSHASAFIDKLEEKAGVKLPATVPPTQPGQPPQYNRQDLINKRQSGEFTTAQTLRAFVEQKTVWDAYFFKAFVAMEYFGYLRRDPENAGYDDWVDVLTNGRSSAGIAPGDFRHLVFGFIYSEEYRERFGPK